MNKVIFGRFPELFYATVAVGAFHGIALVNAVILMSAGTVQSRDLYRVLIPAAMGVLASFWLAIVVGRTLRDSRATSGGI